MPYDEDNLREIVRVDTFAASKPHPSGCAKLRRSVSTLRQTPVSRPGKVEGLIIQKGGVYPYIKDFGVGAYPWMAKMLKRKKAQSPLEYALIIAAVVAGLLVMQTFLKSSLQGRLRASCDQIGDQFDTKNFKISWERRGGWYGPSQPGP